MLTVSTTERVELVDVTDQVRAAVAASGVRDGLVNLCSLHTTAAVLVSRSDGTLLTALRRALEEDSVSGGAWMTPPTAGAASSPDAAAHIGMLMLGHSLTLQISGGEPVLGEWQRVLLAELDGPRARQLRIQLWGMG